MEVKYIVEIKYNTGHSDCSGITKPFPSTFINVRLKKYIDNIDEIHVMKYVKSITGSLELIEILDINRQMIYILNKFNVKRNIQGVIRKLKKSNTLYSNINSINTNSYIKQLSDYERIAGINKTKQNNIITNFMISLHSLKDGKIELPMTLKLLMAEIQL